MKRTVLLFAALLALVSLRAQSTIRHTFEWSAEPERFTFEGTRIERWTFAGAAFSDEWPALPVWKTRFTAEGPGRLQVDIVEAAWEDFVKAPDEKDEAALADTLRIAASLIRDPEGWFGKVSLIPIIRTREGRYRRLTSLTLRVRTERMGTARSNPPPTELSVLRDGDIYKLAVSEEGMHKLTYDFLKNQLGITNLDQVDPRTIRLYGNGGGILPYSPVAERPDDLIENHVRIVGEEDGRFDAGDYLLFYAPGPHRWTYDAPTDRFSRRTNIYDNHSYYFIRIGASGEGLRLPVQPNGTGATATVTAFDDVQHFEEDKFNILKEVPNEIGSGQTWYGDFFRIAREKTYPKLFNFPNLVTSEPVQAEAVMALRTSGTSSSFFLDVNGQQLRSGLAPATRIGDEITSPAANRATLSGQVSLSQEAVDVVVSYPFPAGARESEAWLDFIRLRARRRLVLTGEQLIFRDTRTIGQAAVRYQLEVPAGETEVWDITDPLHPLRQEAGGNGNTLEFTAPATELRQFAAFTPGATLKRPEPLGRIDNQNLHGITRADMLIIYHPDLEAQAGQLAEHRRTHSGLTVEALNVDQIYNEFSSGAVDPSAIRDMARMVFQRDPQLRYLLLIGDGSFDTRDIYGLGTNLLPVYEHDGEPSGIGSYPSDDYYGIFFGDISRDPLSFDLSIAVGRLPVKTVEETDGVIRKIIRYDTDPVLFGDWRTRMVYVGDDEDGTRHSTDADQVAQTVKRQLPMINLDKLFFDLFPQQSTQGGDRFPDVTEGIDRAMFRGALAITYLGHGGPRGWGQERVLSIPQARKWNNGDRLPVFITATCTFGAYDDAAFVSAGEEILLNPRGGAIALMTTTRPVYATQNYLLTNSTMLHLTERVNGRWQTLGDVIRQAKNDQSAGSTPNVRKYALLGDPATVIALPQHNIVTTSINSQPADPQRRDTLRALQQVTISGAVSDMQGQVMENFNGSVYPTVYDKAVIVNTLQQDPGSFEQSVEVQRNVLFKGRATVTGGRFTFSFVLPKDINYAFGPGKVSYYAADPAQRIDAAGSFEQIIIGGTSTDSLADDEGPQVEVFMNSEDFIVGGATGRDVTLLVRLRDDNGINVAGNSIGHDLEAVLDENTKNTFVLNDYYEAEENDYTSGRVRFPLFDLEPGKHTVRVRAWDVANNPAEGLTEFIVAEDGRVALERVLNYPNPFTDRTCFQFDHNLAGEDVEVVVQIFTISGRLIKTIEAFLPAADGALRLDDCIEWDGRDDYGDQLARGVYLYQVRIRASADGERSGMSEFEKLVILK